MTTTDTPTLTLPVGPDDHTAGPSNAPITLVEYGDYECPHCGAAYPVIKEVQQRLGDRLRFVFRNFPLTEIHPRAAPAAAAAEAAATLGAFWPMHDLIFEHQDALDDADLLTYATQLNLDPDAFTAALTSPAIEERIRRDFLSGIRSGVNGTPTFFINSHRHDAPWDTESLLTALTSAIER
jgi:protein-disulfide isomerase